MLAYFIVLIILLFLTFADLHFGVENTKLKRLLLFFAGFLLIFFAGLRWDTGTDWENYEYFFKTIDHIRFGQSGFELFFEVLARIIKYVFGSYQVMLIVTASLIITFTYKTIYNFSPYPLLSVFLLFTYSLNSSGFGYRQDIAISICLLSLFYIHKRELVSFLVCVFIAFLFHQSALIFIPVYWIYKIKWNFKFIAIISAITVVFYLIFSRFGTIIGVLFSESLYKLELYSSEAEGGIIDALIGIVNRLIIIAIPLVIILNNNKHNHINTDLLKSLLNISIIGLILYIILSPLGIVFSRFTRYYDVFQIIILPISLFIANKNEKHLFLYLIIIFYIFKFTLVIVTDQNLFVPYKSVIDFII